MVFRLATLASLANSRVVTLQTIFSTVWTIFDNQSCVLVCDPSCYFKLNLLIKAGDMTLEWPKQDGPSSKAKVDGWDIPHKCKKRVSLQLSC